MIHKIYLQQYIIYYIILYLGGTLTRFLSNVKCVIQKQRRHVFPVMLSEAKLDARQKKTFVFYKLCF